MAAQQQSGNFLRSIFEFDEALHSFISNDNLAMAEQVSIILVESACFLVSRNGKPAIQFILYVYVQIFRTPKSFIEALPNRTRSICCSPRKEYWPRNILIKFLAKNYWNLF